MKSRVTALRTLVVVLITCLQAPLASGTSIVPLAWEELILRSDFVGVVECIQAGGIVAQYRVLESWLGPSKGTEMLVAIEPDPQGNYFPTLLTGQKWLMTASKAANLNESKVLPASGFPLWWRRIQPDYVLPLFQGKWQIDGSAYMAEELSETFGNDVRSLAQVRTKVTELLLRKPSDPKVTIAPKKRATGSPTQPPVSPEQLENARKAFRENEWGPKRWEVFDLLAKHDPAVVAEALLNWESLGLNGKVTEEGYETGSCFCFLCGKDRTALFTKLLKAKDPYVRVAAAVYLCFEDKQTGLRELQNYSELPGIPGDWAAVVRIERGDKDAMPRALSILDPELHPDDNPYVYSQVFIAMRDRLLVVLSNTAFHHQLVLPEARVIETEEEAYAIRTAYYKEMLGWWQRNRNKVELQNPWAAVLEPQKID